MYERFTDRARKVMQLANQEAQRLNHEYIGTEHILLGLVKEGSGVAANVLKNLDVDLRKIRLEVEKLVVACPEACLPGKLPQTPRAKKVLECTIEEARNLNHNYVGTEHLLLGLLREQEGVAAQVLLNLGLRLKDVRKQVLKLIQSPVLREAVQLQLKDVSEEVLNREGANEESLEDSGYRLLPDNEYQACAEKSKTPALVSFGKDLTELARDRKLRPLVGRTGEIEKMLVLLSGRTRPCVLLVGEMGVGKTKLVEGLASRIAGGTVPAGWPLHCVVSLDLGTGLLGADDWRQAGERLRAALHEARQAQIVVSIPALSLLFADWATGLLGMFKAMLRQSPPPLICSVTRAEYRDHVVPNPDLAQLFQPLFVEPLSKADTIEVLRQQRPQFEEHHLVAIADEALPAAVEHADLSLQGCLPGKALQLLDWAAGVVRLRNARRPPDMKELDAHLERIKQAKEKAIGAEDFARAADLRDEGDRLKKQKERLLLEWEQQARPHSRAVDAKSVAEALARMTEQQEPF
jgi:ATP-dependent Clp protease ATP-binding subunit ClpC